MDAIKTLEEYKNKGERVDEVLFHIITKELHHLRTVIDQKNFSIDLIGDQKLQAQLENKQLREALLQIQNSDAWEIDGVIDGRGAWERCIDIADKALEGEPNERM